MAISNVGANCVRPRASENPILVIASEAKQSSKCVFAGFFWIASVASSLAMTKGKIVGPSDPKNPKIVGDAPLRVPQKGGKMKKIATAAVITMTLFLLAATLNIGINFYESTANREARLQGSAAHVEVLPYAMTLEQMTYLFSNLNWQLDYVETSHPNTYIGRTTTNYEGTIEIFSAIPFFMTEWKKIYKPAYTNIAGRYPEAENEILASRHALELLGVDNPKIGMEIELTYDLLDLGVERTQVFILSGLFTDYAHLADRPNRIYCSQDFATAAQTVAVTAENRDALRAVYNKGGISVVFESGGDLAQSVERLKSDFDLTDEQIILSPALSYALSPAFDGAGMFDEIDANVFALDFYPSIYIVAAVSAVVVIAVIGIVRAKKAKTQKRSNTK